MLPVCTAKHQQKEATHAKLAAAAIMTQSGCNLQSRLAQRCHGFLSSPRRCVTTAHNRSSSSSGAAQAPLRCRRRRSAAARRALARRPANRPCQSDSRQRPIAPAPCDGAMAPRHAAASFLLLAPVSDPLLPCLAPSRQARGHARGDAAIQHCQHPLLDEREPVQGRLAGRRAAAAARPAALQHVRPSFSCCG